MGRKPCGWLSDKCIQLHVVPWVKDRSYFLLSLRFLQVLMSSSQVQAAVDVILEQFKAKITRNPGWMSLDNDTLNKNDPVGDAQTVHMYSLAFLCWTTCLVFWIMLSLTPVQVLTLYGKLRALFAWTAHYIFTVAGIRQEQRTFDDSFWSWSRLWQTHIFKTLLSQVEHSAHSLPRESRRESDLTLRHLGVRNENGNLPCICFGCKAK